jgi:hypothetical protein
MARNRKKGSAAPDQQAVTVRISPKDRWLLELLSRAQHQSTSAVFVWTLQVAGRLVDTAEEDSGGRISVLDAAQQSWDPSELQRALTLGYVAPELLDLEQKALLAAFRYSPDLLRTNVKDLEFDPQSYLSIAAFADVDFVNQHFERFKELALKNASTTNPIPIMRNDLKVDEGK